MDFVLQVSTFFYGTRYKIAYLRSSVRSLFYFFRYFFFLFVLKALRLMLFGMTLGAIVAKIGPSKIVPIDPTPSESSSTSHATRGPRPTNPQPYVEADPYKIVFYAIMGTVGLWILFRLLKWLKAKRAARALGPSVSMMPLLQADTSSV